MTVLNKFKIISDDLPRAGDREPGLAWRFNKELRNRGWREARVDTETRLELYIMPYKPAGETRKTVTSTLVSNKGYEVDNFKGCIASDLERNVEDGNLGRGISTYRAFYDTGFIDVDAVIIRTQENLHSFTTRLRLQRGMSEDEAKGMLVTTTITNPEKLVPRMARGGGGGCPLLAIAISSNAFENPPIRQPESLS